MRKDLSFIVMIYWPKTTCLFLFITQNALTDENLITYVRHETNNKIIIGYKVW